MMTIRSFGKRSTQKMQKAGQEGTCIRYVCHVLMNKCHLQCHWHLNRALVLYTHEFWCFSLGSGGKGVDSAISTGQCAVMGQQGWTKSKYHVRA